MVFARTVCGPENAAELSGFCPSFRTTPRWHS